MNIASKPGNRVGFVRVDLFQTHARLANGQVFLPTTLPMGQISDPCPNPSGRPTRRVAHRVCIQHLNHEHSSIKYEHIQVIKCSSISTSK